MKNILVAGGAGYIGSHVVKMLDEAGYHPVVLDNLSTGNRNAVVRGTFIEGDMGNSDLLDEIFNTYPISAVMDFAACIDVGESALDPQKYYTNNICKTLVLLKAMIKHKVDVLIFSSTAAIFGIPVQYHMSETHPREPISPYGRSKLMMEEILKDFSRAYGLRFCSLRYFNAAGGDPDHEIKNYKQNETNLIPVVLRSLKYGNGSITIFGNDYPTPDGTCIRDYIHICDLGAAHLAAMEHLLNGHPSCSFNLGNGNGFSVREIIQAAEEVANRKMRVMEGPRRPGDPQTLVADAAEARRILQWNPRYPELRTMIQHAWENLV